MASSKKRMHPETSLYRRNAARITVRDVLHEDDKRAELSDVPLLRRRARRELEATWEAEERAALGEGRRLLLAMRHSIDAMNKALHRLAELEVPELLGRIDTEQHRVSAALAHLDEASRALESGDFGAAGAAAEEAERGLWLGGGELVVALNQVLSQAAVGKDLRAKLEGNLAERRRCKIILDSSSSRPEKLWAAAELRSYDAQGLMLAADILANQVRREMAEPHRADVGGAGAIRVVPPQQLETFADVGGLADIKEQLRSTVGAILERPTDAARYQVVHNGVLFHGPPGTGKNLLSRALAGEYGMRYLRFSPAAIASAYVHEAAANLHRVFELARSSTPCVLFLDEIDTIASDRGEQPSADHREVVTQLMVCLEEYRTFPGLVIAAATNDLDRLDPALREGRFDAKIYVPLPDAESRASVFRVHLDRRGDAVDWASIDLEGLADKTQGYNAAAVETVVSLAAQRALQADETIVQSHIETAIKERGGRDRIVLDQRVTWEDVVLADTARERVTEILTAFAHPELANELGVSAPAGILFHGPPGTGKTTIAKAMATEVKASFYEQSAAELMSKWAGESEQRVAKLFAKARANRPSIIFIDEIDALLRRRSGDSSGKWEERVVSQFLRELDGLRGGEGVLLVGATNRVDVIDEAIVGRRLVPVVVRLPEEKERQKLLEILCRDVVLHDDVDLSVIASETDGMSGADLKRLCNAAGMKALTRAARYLDSSTGNGKRRKDEVAVTMSDFHAALGALREDATAALV